MHLREWENLRLLYRMIKEEIERMCRETEMGGVTGVRIKRIF